MRRNNFDKKAVLFIMFMFFTFFLLSVIIPFDNAPDESSRYLLAQYMFKYGELPLATSAEVRIPFWGLSYACSPFLSYMISALNMNVVSLFSSDQGVLLLSARFSSVVFSTITVGYIIKISTKLYAYKYRWMFITLCSCFPGFVFISSYVNCDALAMMSTSIIVYAWITGLDTNWNRRSCIHLTIGLIICVLSYLNAYGFILVTIMLLIFELIRAKGKDDFYTMGKKGTVIGVLVCIFSGWFYLRNYLLYGDLFGTAINTYLGETFAVDNLKPSLRETPLNQGKSLMEMLFEMEWIKASYYSFIGMFGNYSLPLSKLFYRVYSCIFVSGLALFWFKLKEGKKIINLIFTVVIFLTISISMFYSYRSDFQPQGRYCLPILIPLMYFICNGLVFFMEKMPNKYNKLLIDLFCFSIIILNVHMIASVFINYYI